MYIYVYIYIYRDIYVYTVKTYLENETINSKDDSRNTNLKEEKDAVLSEFNLNNIKSCIMQKVLVTLKKNGPSIKIHNIISYES